jgi:hypothetical protein
VSRWHASAVWVAFALAALLAFTFGFHRIDSSDIWIHLAAGEYILDHGRVPDRDPFSSESPAPEWINTQWLAETILAALHRRGGWPLLVLTSALVTCASIVLPFAWMLRRGGLAITAAWPFAAAALFSTLIAYERFFVRPEALSFLFTAIWVCALDHADLSRRRPVLLLVLLQIVWCNAHAAFPLGVALGAAAVIGTRIDRGRRAARPAAWWLPLALVAASCVNPYGVRLPLHVLRSVPALDHGPLQEGVVEWQPTFATADTAAIVGDITLVAFIASLGFLAWALVRARRHVPVTDLLVVLGTTLLAFMARRHLAMYAVSALPLAAAALTRARPRFRLSTAAAVGISLLSAAFLAMLWRGDFYARLGPPRVTGWGMSETDHPIGAARVLRHIDVRSPVFTNIAAGSYLLWSGRGDPAPFIDGRLLEPERFARYRAALSATRAFGALAQEQRFEAVLLSMTPHPPPVLFRHLVDVAAWHLVYLDGEGALFVHADVARRHPDLPDLDPEQPLPGLVGGAPVAPGRRCHPDAEARRGELLLRLGYPEAAAADLSRALERCPDARLALLLGGIGSRRAPGRAP